LAGQRAAKPERLGSSSGSVIGRGQHRESELSPGFIADHGDRVREIQAPSAGLHGYTQYLVGVLEPLRRQAASFRSEQQGIVACVGDVCIAVTRLGGKCQGAWRSNTGHIALVAVVNLHPSPFVIIEAGAAQFAVVQIESQGADQVKLSPTICAQAYNVAGVRGNLGLEEDD